MIVGPLATMNISNSDFRLAGEEKWKLKDPDYSNIGYFLK